jgi:hypothetical protein
VAVTNRDDDGCAGTCDGSGACKSKQGQTCGAGCAAGTTCVDGVCCDQACNNPCMACDLSNALGKCTAIPAGQPHGSRTCGAGPCAGSCMGRVDGQCTYPTGSCGTGPTCSGDQVVDQGVCMSGSCMTSNAHPCAGDFACVSGSCKTTCASQSDCVSGAICSQGGICIRILSVSAAGSHTCARLSDGSVRCWGEDAEGELGNGLPTMKSAQPVVVLGLPGTPTTISAKGEITVAVFPGGTFWGWGWNVDRQLTGPSGSAQVQYPAPIEVTLAKGAAQVESGGAYSCARRTDGSVFCWGDSRFTGDPEVTGATEIATAGGNICALVAGGAVKCWGYNNHGQLGNNSTSSSFQPKAQTAVGISGATMVTVGGDHVCALLGDGSVKCWGHNDKGQLGDGPSPVDRLVAGPTVTGLSGATAISASPGAYFTCALTSAGAVKCWGANDLGQLGGNGLTGVKSISVGGTHACALMNSGQLRCWGQNFAGQLGNGMFTDSPVPVTVTGW